MRANETWDLIAPVGRPDVLRAATLLASQLAEVEQYRVRLFVDDIAPLTAMNAQIDPELWLQPVDMYELVRLNLAQATVPADNIVRLFGAKVPRKYMERAVYGHRERKLFKVRLLDQAISGHTPAADASNLNFIEVAQGDQPSAAGIIRERHSAAEIRLRWKTSTKLSQATLASLGFGGHLFSDALFICCWGATITDWNDFVASVETASSRPVVLLVEHGEETGKMPEKTAQLPTPVLSTFQNKVRVLELPPMSWRQRDEIVWLSDVVITGHDDMAQRAIESGVPLLWLPTARLKEKGDEKFIEWYSQGADPAIRRCLREVTSMGIKISTRHTLSAYFNKNVQMEVLAANVAKRIARAPLMSRILPTLTSTPASVADNWPLQHKTTIPQSVPGHN